MTSNIPNRVKQTLAAVDNTEIRRHVLNFYEEISGGSSVNNFGIPGLTRRATPREELGQPTRLQFNDSTFTQNASVTKTPEKRRRTETGEDNSSANVVDQSRFLRRLDEKDAEILRYKTKITDLQSQIIRLNSQLKENELKAESARENFDLLKRQNEERVKDIDFELQRRVKEIKELKAELASREKYVEEAKLTGGRFKLTLSQLQENYQVEVDTLRSEFEKEKKSLASELLEANNEASRLRLQVEELQKKSDLMLASRTKASDCGHENLIKEQQQVIEEMQNALMFERKRASEWSDAKTAKLEKELGQLREEVELHRQTAANDLLREEKIRSLENDLEMARQQASQVQKLQSDIEDLKFSLKKWESLGCNLLDCGTVTEAEEKIQDIRSRELILVQEKAELQQEMDAALRAKENAEKRVLAAQEQVKAEQNAAVEQSMRRLRKRIEILQKERDNYRLMMDEWTVAGPDVNAYTRQIGELQEAIRNLEDLLKDYQENAVASSETSDLKQKNEELTKKVEQMEEEMEMRDLVGNYNPITTKVLVFNNNLVAQAYRKEADRFKQLEKENDAMHHRLRLVEEGHSSNLTLLVGEKLDEGATSERVADLEKKLESAELMAKRLEEAFKEHISKYREALFHIFGYQVDSLDMDMYRLTSMYAESEEDRLLFQKTDDGVQLMDSPFTHHVQDLVELHVNQQNSIPAFIAALTIDLFSKQDTLLGATTINID